MPSVPKCWPESTIVCLGTGPSLVSEDVEACRHKARVIAVNDAYRLCPWADALVASDYAWWLQHQGVPSFTGPKWSVQYQTWTAGRRARFPNVQLLGLDRETGISTDPSTICTGKNSGYAAMNIAVHYGARRIVLLGYDMGHPKGQPSHFFGEHHGSLQQKSPYQTFIANFRSTVKPLAALGVEVINCSRETRLDAFPRRPLREVLAESAVAA